MHACVPQQDSQFKVMRLFIKTHTYGQPENEAPGPMFIVYAFINPRNNPMKFFEKVHKLPV